MAKCPPIPLRQCKNPWILLATGFASGCSPWAPGTMGSIVALPIIALFVYWQVDYFWLFTIVLNLFGIVICQKATDILKVHDHSGIVWDEIGGMMITFVFIPYAQISYMDLLLGFALFRFFDILKPFPIRLIDQKVSGGFGIMLDDVLAGLFAALILFNIQTLV